MAGGTRIRSCEEDAMADTPQILGDKIRTLEDEFFRKEDQRLTARLKELRDREVSREALAKASGIKNPATIDKLLQLGIQADVLAALAIVPLVEVAWADGSLDDKERQAILERAEKSGIAPGSADHVLLQSWLERRPEPKLLTAWIHMVEGVCEYMSPAEAEALRAGLVERAQAVASASGGFLGARKVSGAEAVIIRQLESAFRRQ
jgi:hypothetical protein